jgi:hypothetical protein
MTWKRAVSVDITRLIGELVPVKWFLNQNTIPDMSIE